MKRDIENAEQAQLAVNPAMRRTRICVLWTVLAALVAAIGALSVALLLLTRFEVYDDEGYMLVSFVHYINQGHLYTQTFGQYGPFYFYAQGIFFQLLHLPVTHDMGRLVTLVYWVASSLLAAVFVHRISKSPFLASAAGLCVMLAGRVLTYEPNHPQQVLLLLYMLAACLSLPALPGRSYLRLFLLGCVGAALMFTKVNVGVFYIAGLAHALICLLPSGRIRSIGLGLTLAYAAAGPWLLMHASFNHGFLGYCLLATVGGIFTFSFGALVRPRDRLPIRAALSSGAGLGAGTALIIIGTLLQGVPVGSLVWGVVLNPLHQPKLFSFLLSISGSNLLAAIILSIGLVGLRLSGRLQGESRWLDMLKCAAGVGSIFLLTLRYEIQWILPLLPLTLMPRSDEKRDAATLFPRLFITCMAVTQFLEPFPVAGSQMGIAAAPMILWAFVCVSDGIAGLRTCWRRPSESFEERFRLDAVIGGAILVVLAGISVANAARMQFPPATTGLRGSEWLHLPVEQAAQFETISRNVSTNCGILFTMPGMGSFNIWSGVPTPNGWNHGAWMGGIPLNRQAEILSIIKADPRACAILNRGLVRFWDKDDASVAALPLAHYIVTDMPKVAEFGEYEIHVHPKRSSPWMQLQ